MRKSTDFLKHIFHEDLYIIDEQQKLIPGPPEESNKDVSLNEQDVQQIKEPQLVKYLGSNNKGILILINDNENEFLNRTDLDFLMKIIESGLKYTKSDIGLVNCAKLQYQQIFNEVHHSYIIAFGTHKTQLLDGQPKYHVFEVDGIKILIADDLSIIEGDRDKKMHLWKALQRMFDLN